MVGPVSRPTRIHARAPASRYGLCGVDGTTTPEPSRVTCKRCLAKTPRVSEIDTTISHTTEHTQ